MLSARVTDLLDGRYRAKVYGIAAAHVALELRTPGGRITVLSAGQVPEVPGAGGCAVGRGGAAAPGGTWLLLIGAWLLAKKIEFFRGGSGSLGGSGTLAPRGRQVVVVGEFGRRAQLRGALLVGVVAVLHAVVAAPAQRRVFSPKYSSRIFTRQRVERA